MKNDQSEQRRIERIRTLTIKLQTLMDHNTSPTDERFLSLIDSLTMELIAYLNQHS